MADDVVTLTLRKTQAQAVAAILHHWAASRFFDEGSPTDVGLGVCDGLLDQMPGWALPDAKGLTLAAQQARSAGK